MVDKKVFKAGDVILREGDTDRNMYEIMYGIVGVFIDYGKPTQVKLAELQEDYFGETELYAENPERKVTAVALTDTEVEIITKENLDEYIDHNLFKIGNLLRTMTKRIERMDYHMMNAYECIEQYKEQSATKEGVDMELLKKMKRYSARA